MSNLKTALIATASAGALSLTLGISPAAATPPSFTINPDVLGVSGYSTTPPIYATDITITSDALIQQNGANQMEFGYAQGGNFINNGALIGNPTFDTGTLSSGFTGLSTPPGSNTYGLYLVYSGTVHDLSGFGASTTPTAADGGTVGPGDYSFALIADVGNNDTFTRANENTNTSPTVTNTSGDVVLAVGTSLFGVAGFNAAAQGPNFGVVANFIVCNGTNTNSATVDSSTAGVESSTIYSCGGFDATSYFTSPTPFYDISNNTSTGGSVGDYTCPGSTPTNPINSCGGPDVRLDVAGDINFEGVPEPATLAMFGSALILLGAFGWKQRRKA